VSRYTYLGDRLTDPRLKGQTCEVVRNSRGKCVRGRMGTMLVRFGGETVNVVGRLLRKQPQHAAQSGE
jgi:RNase P/RNase MRP subunit p29